MIGKIAILSAVMALAVSIGQPDLARAAGAAFIGSAESSASEAGRAAPAPIKLAQERELEIVYDEYGRRLLVDPETRVVVGVMPDRAPDDRYRERPRWRDRDGYDRRRLWRDDGDDGAFLGGPRDARRLGGGAYEGRYDAPEGWATDDEPFPDARPGADEGSQHGPQAYPDIETVPQPGRQAPDQQQTLVEREPLPEAQPQTGGDQPSMMQTEPPAPAAQPPAPGGEPFVSRSPALGPITSSTAVAQVQVLLDRAGASPGVIDGHFGDNVRKALAAYKEITGKPLNVDDPQAIKAALDASGGPAFTSYTITDKDAAGPYIASVPEDYSAKAKLDRLGYASVAEMLAERFHMDENYLKSLNPGANFNRPGTVLKVAQPGAPKTAKVARIVADKGKEEVFAYDDAGKLVASYPATIGSTDTPSPSGTVKVERVAYDPTYTYNPKINFKQGNNSKVLTIPPGPNGPVGSVWIALSKPTYGIHGTPEPSKIGKTNSHGCVRLTNWDAQELAHMVSPGVWVQFVD